MDVNTVLKNTENTLRDFISSILSEKLGEHWIQSSGISKERLLKWEERMLADHSSSDQRLIYYSDFFDLKTIIAKNWILFEVVFGDKRSIEVYLENLEGFRNADAHRREMLPYQISLVEGICGEIKTNIVKYRSKKETGQDCFARFEFAQDNYNNSWKIGDSNYVDTNLILRPGDTLEFVANASDPEDSMLEYKLLGRTEWQDGNKFSIKIEKKDISKNGNFFLLVKSKRDYFAHPTIGADDSIQFCYKILPVIT